MRMRRNPNPKLLVKAVLAALGPGLGLGLLSSCSQPAVAPDRSTAFVGARIIDGTGASALDDGVIVVRDGRIEAVGARSAVEVPAGAQTIDVSGKTIVPGLINAHAHASDVLGLESDHYTEENLIRQLALYARYGVTTAVSLGGDGPEGIAVRDAQDEMLRHARLYVAGDVVTGTTVEEVQAKVDENAAMGVDMIKIRVDDNLGSTEKMPPELYQAVIDRAHEKGLQVASHLFYLEDAKGLLRAGTDFIAHSVRDEEVDDELLELLEETSVCYCPTLTREVSTFVYEAVPDFFEDPFFLKDADPAVLEQLKDPEQMQGIAESASAQAYKTALDVAKTNLKKVHDGGATVAFGTDTGPPARFQGYFEHMEMELMAEAGMSPEAILLSATGNAARCLELEDVGTLAPGKWADFIVLNEDPLENIRNMRSIDAVYIAGNRVPEETKRSADSDSGSSDSGSSDSG